MEVDIELDRHPRSVARARRAVSGLAEHVAPRRLEDLRLLVSEVVTNAIRHSGAESDAIALRVVTDANGTRVEVRDRGPGFVYRGAPADRRRTSGWGLYLVAEIADAWGIDRGEHTCVWFELR